VEYDDKLSKADADKYFENPKVNKKYKLKVQLTYFSLILLGK
jgi:hypothetical protein